VSYPPDPGDVFASDVHRRVMANCPNPDDDHLSSREILEQRVAKDDHLAIDDVDELHEVLEDLRAAGHVTANKGCYRNTKSGFAALTNAEENADG
jgi:hypothetical protein